MKRKIDKMSTNAFSHSKRTAALLVALSDTKERGRREDAERGRCGGRRAMRMECQSARDGGAHAGLHLVFLVFPEGRYRRVSDKGANSTKNNRMDFLMESGTGLPHVTPPRQAVFFLRQMHSGVLVREPSHSRLLVLPVVRKQRPPPAATTARADAAWLLRPQTQAHVARDRRTDGQSEAVSQVFCVYVCVCVCFLSLFQSRKICSHD